MTAEEIISLLEEDSFERLRWLVLSKFRVLPGSNAAKELSDEDFIFCGAHMVLDMRLSSENPDLESGLNHTFDQKRFLQLSEAKL